LLVKVPADGQLRCTGLEPSGAGQIGHTGGFLLGLYKLDDATFETK
jgi:hypothetical protein